MVRARAVRMQRWMKSAGTAVDPSRSGRVLRAATNSSPESLLRPWPEKCSSSRSSGRLSAKRSSMCDCTSWEAALCTIDTRSRRSRGSEPAAGAGGGRRGLGEVLGDPEIGGFEVVVVHNAPSHDVKGISRTSSRRAGPRTSCSCTSPVTASRTTRVSSSSPRATPGRTGSAPPPWRPTSSSAACAARGLAASCSSSTAATAAPSARASRSAPPGRSTSWRASRRDDSGRPGPGGHQCVQRDGVRLRGTTLRRTTQSAVGLHLGRRRRAAAGDADRDEDGLVSLNELYDYVFDRSGTQPRADPGS